MRATWSPENYLKFEDHRTRPARDLLTAVPNLEAKSVIDIGCGPGNSTELLVARYPNASISGMDSSADMIETARRRLPGVHFTQAQIEEWHSSDTQDLIFANAVLQWLPDHSGLLPRLVRMLQTGGTLAVQMPDNLEEPSHVAMREAATDPRWAAALSGAERERTSIATPQSYYAVLKPHCRRVDVWRTIYHHPLNGLDGIIEWFSSTGLLPYLSRLEPDRKEEYLASYRVLLARHYPVMEDGTTLLAFPRVFIVATR